MKFLCERCKTRYSIADERVRGKILKVRCKNCSNVITVREGMPEPEPEPAAEAAARRVTRPTDYAPAVVTTGRQAAVTGSHLRSAFEQAMDRPAAPPPQIEEEWYVSIDGEQAGPFRLDEAQAWIRARKADDELFCWCEGFDDWLPVEKVSHFRGLRRAAPPRAPTGRPVPPPPGSRARTGAVAAVAAREEEPRPLFAATLAALEADVGAKAEGGAAKPALARATPVGGTAARPAAPLAPPPTLPAATPPPDATVLPRPRPGPALGAGLFDESEGDGDGHGAAESGSAPFKLDDLARGNGKARAAAPADADADADAPGAGDPDADGDDDDLAIGEVSRVVRLTDLAAQARRPAAKKPAATRATAAIASQALVEAATPASPLAEAAASSLRDEHGEPAAAAASPEGPAPLAPAAQPPRRRQQAALLAAGGVLLIGVVVVAIVFATGGGDDDGARSHGGGGADIEGLARTIDDPRYPRIGAPPGGGDPTGADAADPKKTGGATVKRPGGTTGGTPGGTTGGTSGTGPGTGAGTGKVERAFGPDGQPLEPLRPEDVITQALKMSSGTQRCYERALKADPFLKVQAIAAVITVSASGQVGEVTLDQMADHDLGKCLIAAIKRWPFRQSTGGITTKITLKFQQS